MPNIDRHAPGTFTWIELATSDQDAANKFYAELFGYKVIKVPMNGGLQYAVFRIDNRAVAGCYAMQNDEKGISPHWNLYVSVTNADESARRATGLGGKVKGGPSDAMNAGRWAELQDMEGATFGIWQAAENPGIGITGVPGTLCWADLNTHAPFSANQFYGGLFGWKIMTDDKSGYLHIKNGEEFIGGVPPAAMMGPNTPSHWMIYLFTEDVGATANRAKDLGANILMPPMKIQEVGEMAVIADPQGAVFALFAPTKATA